VIPDQLGASEPSCAEQRPKAAAHRRAAPGTAIWRPQAHSLAVLRSWLE